MPALRWSPWSARLASWRTVERAAQNPGRAGAGPPSGCRSLAAAEAQAPDLQAAERALLAGSGAGKPPAHGCGRGPAKSDRPGRSEERPENCAGRRAPGIARRVGHYRQLERAFGKDGVPALFIEQALPQIETKANEILDRLSAGGMSVRFVTQAAYKDTRRQDLTRDAGYPDQRQRRAARLRNVLRGGGLPGEFCHPPGALGGAGAARRARLQTLVIDEGFGSQDAWGASA